MQAPTEDIRSGDGAQGTPHRRLVVVGAGISGLAAAWSAWEAGGSGPTEVLVLEADPEVGGKAKSLERDGYLVEAGPTGYLDNEPVLEKLVERAGVEKLPADQAAARRFLVRGGKAREIKTSPVGFLRSGIISPLGLMRMLREPWIKKRVSAEEETIWAFAERRLGREVAAQMIAPMVLGVFAGDAKKLSLPAAFPRMAELEAEYASLFRAMAKLARAKKLEGGPSGPSGALTSFADGLQTLPRGLAQRAPFEVRCGARVESVTKNGERWQIRVGGEESIIEADALVLAGESYSTSALLGAFAPKVAAELDALPTPGVAVVALGYGAEALGKVPHGFGALIPRGEGLRILGCLWDTHLFAGRAPDGQLLVRCMLGGSTDLEAADLSDDELRRTAIEDMAKLFGLREAPTFSEVISWQRAIPQYEVGHLARVERIDAALAEHNGQGPVLQLAGNHTRGIAFGKAAAEGWRAGEAAALALSSRSPN